ncbi:phage tail tape measure protein [Candidatus Contubernalis alkaliaceticus]|uniref:phage tail tape measure protein n=1 Tax=Candidatus Contubernalis alkaliaceticus TaxID=338645 RepID=UPI001F4C468D|nr:phage tail tape measure protein [Candidatus Contubernalis alkalaceticus]UNC92706.1 phage tail tape measure protein [Candidatus Contubernalis alkalaceticus]
MSKYITAPLALVGGAALKMSADFEKGLANVDTLLGGNAKRIDEFKTGIQDLAMVTGKSTSDLTDGMYQVVSAFGDTAESINILETAAKAGAAGLSSTESSINLLSAVIKGYNLDVKEAEQVSDYAFKTVALGQTTFDELASSMGKVIPLAASMNLGQEELWGTMATLTGVTGSTAEVTTQLRAVLQGLMKPSGDMQKALKAIGFESGTAAIETLGLEGVLKALEETTGGNSEELAGLWGQIEAGTAVLALTGGQAETWSEKIGEMGDVAGETANAFEIQSQTMAFQWEQMKQAGVVVLQEIGDAVKELVMPIAQELIPRVQKVVEWFRNLDSGTKTMIVTIAGLLAAIGPILVVLGTLITSIGTVAGALSGIALGPIALVVGAIIGLIAIFKHLWETNEGFRDTVLEIWENLKQSGINIFETLKETLTSVFESIKQTIEFVLDGIAVFWDNWGETILGVATVIWNQIELAITTAIELISSIINIVLALIRGDWEEVWENIKEIGLTIWNFISQTVQNIFEALAIFLSGIWTNIKNKAEEIWTNLKNSLEERARSMAESVSNRITNLRETLSNLWGNMLAKVREIWENIRSNAVSKALELYNNVKTRLEQLWNWIKGIPSQASTWGRDIFESLRSAAVQKASETYTNVKSKFDEIWTYFKNLPSQARQWGRDIIDGLRNGILSLAGSVGSSVTNFIKTNITDRIKNALKLSSPSKVMFEFGEFVSIGLSQGISAKAKDVMDAVSNMTDKAINIGNVMPDLNYAVAGVGFVDDFKEESDGVSLRIDKLINIEGNVDKSVIPDIEKIAKETVSRINKTFKMSGYKRRV